ncbi:hypothetical protein [Nocardioides dongkuii]|uniref:hypothetical protein n=1 Tax=Nocardioides dongkuii TaxID=2760089 RepID=UPI0015FE3DB0|nr:hypothetical protein [Nocardioides dongkuii]
MRFLRALMVVLATCAFITLPATSAQAHTPQFSADCTGIKLSATAYDANKANTWSVTINGATQSGTFGASFSKSFAVPQAGATTTWSAEIVGWDGKYKGTKSGKIGPCGTPPPVDVCPALPGNQPTGTSCTPPPNVERSEKKVLDGCEVKFDGITYGAGSLTYNELFTDTFVFNPANNAWDLVVDTTATIANLSFSPWTKAQQVAAGCVTKPGQPSDVIVKDTTSECIDGVQVTTTTTTTTPYVYDEDTNEWVLGDPVTTTEQTESAAECGVDDNNEEQEPEEPQDNGVSPTTENAQPPAGTSPVSGGTAAVPTAVDAGLSDSVRAASSGSAGTPWGLLVGAFGALLIGGSVLTRRVLR